MICKKHLNVMLLPTSKYGTETSENSYRSHMKLTVNNLQPRDFGNYRCISKNSLGETEGSIRLYEIPVPSVAPKTVEQKATTKEVERQVASNETKQSQLGVTPKSFTPAQFNREEVPPPRDLPPPPHNQLSSSDCGHVIRAVYWRLLLQVAALTVISSSCY